MSENHHNHIRRLPFGSTSIRSAIAKNLQSFESETEGDGYISLWDVPSLLSINDDDLVILLAGRYVPAPELFSDGLYFERLSLLAALHRLTNPARAVVSGSGEGEQ